MTPEHAAAHASTPWGLLALAALLPAFGALVNGLNGLLFRRRTGTGFTGTKFVNAVALGSVGLAFLIILAGFVKLLGMPAEARSLHADLWTWFDLGGARVNGGLATMTMKWGYKLDPLSACMGLLVSGAGFLIHLFSTGYMADAMETGATLRSRESVVGTTTPLPSARTDHDLRLKGPRARELLVTPSTRASTVAVYLDSWRRKVERIGTLHFPNEARRQHMSGSPVLEVVLRSDGRLAEVWIRRSSGHAELDQAAIGVLKMASPFDPFPASLAAGHDTLRFAYEWQFIGGASAGSLVSSMPDTD